jgi:hypothetical protein
MAWRSAMTWGFLVVVTGSASSQVEEWELWCGTTPARNVGNYLHIIFARNSFAAAEDGRNSHRTICCALSEVLAKRPNLRSDICNHGRMDFSTFRISLPNGTISGIRQISPGISYANSTCHTHMPFDRITASNEGRRIDHASTYLQVGVMNLCDCWGSVVPFRQ